ncbi:GDSL esterase/lipase CPRD49 isoform X2 [Amborella trichopoda]|uniref:GDSL esterase/lipase CPRD49 isoform X2 n=1 Tax=Amborella trichopoda TaxID=13333 RepID=UPI0005D300CB|nr:GDSL esterase/lipase CPRD49 isoform X2 [Amborella trichopoda]|eukprot:XP_011624765.1 GDSL esterase/lipase CPRD49 isoform X2 [Amborella trichopoda]
MLGPCRPQIVLFGSSIVQFSFANGGWGATLADIYARKDADIQPSLVIMYFGGNDAMGPHSSGLGPHVPLSECKENLRKLANHILSLSEKTRLILLSCPPVNEDMFQSTTSGIFGQVTRSNEICRQYSEACIELCKEMGLKVVDLWTSIQKRDDWATACLTDGVHFSSEGSDILVAEILQILKEAEWEPSLHWKALPTEFAEDSPYDLAASDGKSTLNISEWIFHREDKWD